MFPIEKDANNVCVKDKFLFPIIKEILIAKYIG